jgi:hypothetical protein
MAASNYTTDWVALARSLWRGAEIIGTGPHAVVVRCFQKEVHLFDEYTAARAFEAGNCCPTCASRHTWGSLVPHIPAPPARRQIRNLGLMERE